MLLAKTRLGVPEKGFTCRKPSGSLLGLEGNAFLKKENSEREMESKTLTLGQLFEQSAPEDSRKTLYFDRNGQELTFAVFYNRVELVTELLKKQGIKKGDVVALLSENTVNWACAYFAIARVGGVALPLLPEMSDRDLALFFSAHEVALAFTSSGQKERLRQFAIGSLRTIVALENFSVEKLPENKEDFPGKLEREFEKFKKAALVFMKGLREEETVEVTPDDPFCILYVPDTKNCWQQVHLSHRNIISAAENLAQTLQLHAEHRVAIFLPLSFTLPVLLGVLIPLLVNAQAVLSDFPQDEKQFRQWLKRFRPTHLLVDTNYAQRLFKQSRKAGATESLFKRSLRLIRRLALGFFKTSQPKDSVFSQNLQWLICTNFAPLGKQLRQFLVREKINHRLLLGHFQTASVFMTGKAEDNLYWAQGQLLPQFEWKILAEGDDEKSGELALRGPMVSLNESDKKEITDGYLKTGWLVRRHEARLCVLGRKASRILLPSGECIFPELLEAVLNEYDWVAESLVYLEGDALFVRLYPETVYANKVARTHPERLAIELLQHINKQLPENARLHGVSIEEEPFKKNILGQIIR